MNHLETGVSNATVTADAAIPAPIGPASNSGLVWNGSSWVAATLVNANISAAAAIAYSKLNLAGGIVNNDVSGSAAIAASKLDLSTVGTVPTGSITQYGSSSAPSGWVLCDGTSYLRADGTHDALFAVIGTAYGTVDGTHFNVPDLRGRVAVGLGTNASVNALNTNDGQTVANRRPHHRTTLADPGHNHPSVATGTGAGSNNRYVTADSSGASTTGTPPVQITGVTVGTGNANDALDTPSFIVVTYIIKL